MALIFSFMIVGLAKNDAKDQVTTLTSPPASCQRTSDKFNGNTRVDLTASPQSAFAEVILILNQQFSGAAVSPTIENMGVTVNNLDLRNTIITATTSESVSPVTVVSGAQQDNTSNNTEVKQNLIFYTSGSVAASFSVNDAPYSDCHAIQNSGLPSAPSVSEVTAAYTVVTLNNSLSIHAGHVGTMENNDKAASL